jgi:peptide/nickel transport system substrate-binding protein
MTFQSGLRGVIRAVFLVVFVTLLTSVVLAQDTGDIPREETLIIGWEGDAAWVNNNEDFNFYVGDGRDFFYGVQLMAESLFYLNAQTGENIPWLASGFEFNEDFSTVDVFLREGVTWSDGEAFNADDVVFTINMVKDNNLRFFSGDMRRWVEDVEAVDELTVRFTLTAPNPRFLVDFFSVDISRGVVIVPEHIFSTVEDVTTFTYYDPEQGWPVYTGPYEVARTNPGEIVYTRRDNWWGSETGFSDLPAPRQVIYGPMGTEDVAAARMENNELDAAIRMEASVFETISGNNPNIIAWREDAPYAWTDPCPRTYAINTQREPWTDPAMRRAVSFALDREAIAEAALGLAPGGEPAPFTFPAYGPLLDVYEANSDLLDQYQPTTFDPDMARELIEGAGFTLGSDGVYERDGERLTLEWIGPNNWGPGLRTFPLIEFYLDEVGIDATATLSSDFGDRRATGDFDVIGFSPCGSVVDVYGDLDIYHNRHNQPMGERVSQNFSRWNNERFSEIADEVAVLSPDDEQVAVLFREAFEIWLQEQPALPIHQQLRVMPFNTTYWTNWPTDTNAYMVPPMYAQTALYIIVNLEPAS